MLRLNPKTHISRAFAISKPHIMFIFTDNWNRSSGNNRISDNKNHYTLKYGNGKYYPKSTLAVVRGLNNAYPISTMKTQFKEPITDDLYNKFCNILDEEIKVILDNMDKYEMIYIPESVGRGTYSNMPKTAPKCYKYLQIKLLEILNKIR